MKVFHCYACGQKNDGRVVEWCSCVTTEPTLVCSGCGLCFCDAPQQYRRSFWQTASAELRARRREAQSVEGREVASRTNDPARPMILVVDDDRIVHFIVNRALSSFRVNIVHARDGREGLEKAKELRPDLILTDALLPKLDGRELCRALKSDPATETCKIVVMSGFYRGLKYRNEALQTFLADDYLEKPISQKNLFAAVTRFLDLETRLAPPAEKEPAGAGSLTY
jgi:two-component system, OmpR family, alkaline phosphatase synthesis response regulator PhoP